jgi:protein-S-isoprenylcysteine O-methyltransferase Ste14
METYDKPVGSGSVWKWLIKNIAFLFIMAFFLFVPAGSLNWPWGKVLLVVYAASIGLSAIILVPRDSGLLAERSEVQAGAKKWDLAMSSFVALIGPLLYFVVAGLDYRYGWSSTLPPEYHVTGLLLAAAGQLIITWAMFSNRFFSSVVRIQADRGHTVVSSGPYRYVRHPGYIGLALFHVGSALILGSLPAFIVVLLIICVTVIRTAMEDKALQKELAGYKEYAGRVRYRLLPGIW